MNEKQARLTDLVKISCPHGPQIGVITTASQFAFADSLGEARLTDEVVCTKCGAKGYIVSGADFTFVDMLKSARVRDITIGTCNPGCKTCPHGRSGEIITGSQFMFAT
jgi:uncharacterized Zn-binding protein involved in type VI secretion